MRLPVRSDIQSYLLSYNLYCMASGFVGIFLNLYFLTAFSYVAVLYFQLATYVVALVAYLFAGYLLKRHAPRALYVLGLSFFVFVLAGLLSSLSIFSNVLVFGGVWGAATGVFFAGNNVIMYDITKGQDRTSFVATNNYLNGAVALVAPALAGLLIQLSTAPGVQRFFWDFTVTSILFAAAALSILRLRADRRSPIDYSLTRTTVGRLPGYDRFRVYFVTSQWFTMAYGIVLPLYVFQTSGSFFVAGIFASYLVMLSVVANILFRKGFREDGRLPGLAVAGILLSSLVLCAGVPAPANAFLFGGCYTVLATPLNNSAMVRFMAFLDRNARIDRTRFWSNREYYLGVGRLMILGAMIALLGLAAMSASDLVYLVALLSLYSLVFLTIEGRGGAARGSPSRGEPEPGEPAAAAAG